MDLKRQREYPTPETVAQLFKKSRNDNFSSLNHSVPQNIVPIINPPNKVQDFFTDINIDKELTQRIHKVIHKFPPPLPPMNQGILVPFIYPPPPIIDESKLPYSLSTGKKLVTVPPLPFPPIGYMPYPLNADKSALPPTTVFDILLQAGENLPRSDMLVASAACTLDDLRKQAHDENFDHTAKRVIDPDYFDYLDKINTFNDSLKTIDNFNGYNSDRFDGNLPEIINLRSIKSRVRTGKKNRQRDNLTWIYDEGDDLEEEDEENLEKKIESVVEGVKEEAKSGLKAAQDVEITDLQKSATDNQISEEMKNSLEVDRTSINESLVSKNDEPFDLLNLTSLRDTSAPISQNIDLQKSNNDSATNSNSQIDLQPIISDLMNLQADQNSFISNFFQVKGEEETQASIQQDNEELQPLNSEPIQKVDSSQSQRNFTVPQLPMEFQSQSYKPTVELFNVDQEPSDDEKIDGNIPEEPKYNFLPLLTKSQPEVKLPDSDLDDPSTRESKLELPFDPSSLLYQYRGFVSANGNNKAKRTEEFSKSLNDLESYHHHYRDEFYKIRKNQLLKRLQDLESSTISLKQPIINDPELAEFDRECQILRDEQLLALKLEKNYELLKAANVFYQDSNRVYKAMNQITVNKLEKLKAFFKFQKNLFTGAKSDPNSTFRDINHKDAVKVYSSLSTHNYNQEVKTVLQNTINNSDNPITVSEINHLRQNLVKLTDNVLPVQDFMPLITPAEFNVITGDLPTTTLKASATTTKQQLKKHPIFNNSLYTKAASGSDSNASDSSPTPVIKRRGRRPNDTLLNALVHLGVPSDRTISEATLLAKIMKNFYGPQGASNDEFQKDFNDMGVKSRW